MSTSFFKLVNKTSKTTFPESFNQYTTAFHFDQRITRLYEMKVGEGVPVIDSSGVILDNGTLEFIGDMKNNMTAFLYYMNNTHKPSIENTLKYWRAVMASGICEGDAGLQYFKFYNLLDMFNKEVLLSAAIEECSAQCVEFLLDHFNITNAEVYLKDVMSLTDIAFVKAIVPHMSDDFVNLLDVDTITAKHRYADVRRYLNTRKIELYAKNQNHEVIIKTA